MQAKKAAQLRENWGDKPCPHESLAKEYDQGTRSGNYVCKTCGRLFTFGERAEWKARRAPAGSTEDIAKAPKGSASSQGDGQP